MINANDPEAVQCIENKLQTEGVSDLLYGSVSYSIQKDPQNGEAKIRIQYSDTFGNKIDQDIILRLVQQLQEVIQI